MAGIVDIKMRALFFDAPKVQKAVKRAKRKALSKGGAFIRQTSRRSIRRRKRISKPGSPPSSRTGTLKRFLFFSYDSLVGSVVVGPQKLGVGTAPHALEFGGTSIVKRRVKGGSTRRRRFSRRVIRVKARPFMGPALKKEAPRLPRLWRNSVKG